MVDTLNGLFRTVSPACETGISAADTRLPPRERCLCLVVAVVVLTLFGVATVLEPDRRGHGTHQQLGMPACGFVVLFGQPCPGCGMTTSWALLVRGRGFEAIQTNVGGVLLALGAGVIAGLSLMAAASGRWPQGTPSQMDGAAIFVGILLITVVDWTWRHGYDWAMEAWSRW